MTNSLGDMHPVDRSFYNLAIKERNHYASVIRRLVEALLVSNEELGVAASYLDDPDITIGLRVHAKACSRALTLSRAALAIANEAGFTERLKSVENADGGGI